MADDYIRVYTKGRDEEDGFKLLISLVSRLQFDKGIRTGDLSLTNTGAGERLVTPISGNIEDFRIVFDLIDDPGVTKGFQIDNIGNETPLTIITTDEQVNFLLDSIMQDGIGLSFELYNSWLDRSIFGFLTISGQAEGDDFFTKVRVNGELKEGVNFFEFA